MNAPAPGRRVAERKRARPRLPGSGRSGPGRSGSGRSGPGRPSLSAAGPGALAGLVLVLLAGVLVATAGFLGSETEPTGGVSKVPVTETSGACLGSPWEGSARAATVAAPLPQGSAPESEPGRLTSADVGSKARPVKETERGVLAPLKAPSGGSALAVTATGDAAVGRGTFQTEAVSGAGLATQECLAPRARWWFTGGGADLDHRSRLVLANLDPGPAVVDVLVQGPEGPADDVGTRGITIAPGEVYTLDLIEVAPQADELAVHVEASRGRVVAGLADSFATQPAASPGVEWVPGQPNTSRVVRLGPLPRSADGRTLVVANPTDREAIVEVKISGRSGTFAPSGLEQLTVPPQSVATADLGDSVGDDASTVVLRSQVPVSATVRSSDGSDVTYAGAVPVLDGPAAAVLAEDAKAEVHLAAGGAGGTATLTAYSADGKEVGRTELKIDPTATASWKPKGSAAYVVVTPTRGAVSGGVSLSGASGVSQVALQPLPVVLRQPVVVPVVG